VEIFLLQLGDKLLLSLLMIFNESECLAVETIVEIAKMIKIRMCTRTNHILHTSYKKAKAFVKISPQLHIDKGKERIIFLSLWHLQAGVAQLPALV
jgi:hypothetical protein